MKSTINKSILWLTAVLCFTAFHFEKSLKIYGLILYPLVTFIILSYVSRNINLILRIVEKYNPKLIFLFFLLLLIIAYSFWYPYEDIRSRGTDRDEALNQAVLEVTHLKYPYYARTIVTGKPHELGLDNNPITVMPGSILFAAPFVLIGNSTYQNFFWMAVFFLFLAQYYQSDSRGLLFIILNTILCGTFLFQIFIGSDYIANSIWILIFTHLFLSNSKSFNKKSLIYSFLLGFGLSSRFNFTIIIIPLIFYFYYSTNLNNTIKQIASVMLGFFLITVPFLLFDYNNFTPLHHSNFYVRYDQMIPYSSILFPTLIILLSTAISYYLYKDHSTIYYKISLILLIPVLIIVILGAIKTGKVTFVSSHYAFPAFLFLSFTVFEKVFKGNLNSKTSSIMRGT